MILTRMIPIIACAASLGCVQSVWVHERNVDPNACRSTKKLKGIPFRTKTTIFEQVTSYERRWKKVTLQKKTRLIYTVDGGAKKALESSDPARTTRTPSGAPELGSLRALVVANGPEDQIIDAFLALPVVDIAQIQPRLTGNELKREDVVAHDRELYINSPLPWFGTSSLTAKLAGDGTLTEAAAAAETKLAEGVSTLLPIKEVLSAVATKALDLGEMSGTMMMMESLSLEIPQAQIDQRQVVVFELTVEDEGLIWEFRKAIPTTPADGMLTHIPFEPGQRAHVVKPLPSGSPAKKEKKDDGRKISVTGEVTLPKAASASK